MPAASARRRTGSRAKRAGAILLEAIVALAMLGAIAAAATGLTVSAAQGVRHAADAEGEVRRAGAFLDLVALWPREDLDRRLGRHRQGPWTLDIEHLDESLYEVTLADSGETRRIVGTVLYRPEVHGGSAP